MLNEVPSRGTAMPPTDPLLYRFYELVMVNGPAWKALIEEEFGDGPREDHDVRQVPALQVLRQRAGHPGVWREGDVRGVR